MRFPGMRVLFPKGPSCPLSLLPPVFFASSIELFGARATQSAAAWKPHKHTSKTKNAHARAIYTHTRNARTPKAHL